MSPEKMHADEVDVDAVLVRQLLSAQFPQWAELPISEVRSMGTVNAIYRIGQHLYARLPRVPSWAEDLDNERQWLPILAPRLTLRVPEPVAMGRPAGRYASSWAIYRWIDARPYAEEFVDDECQAAEDLAQFVLELRGIGPVIGAPRAGRKPLREHATATREAIASSREVINSDAATAAWEWALEAPTWAGTPVWIHADLLPPNLLVRGGRLCAVIDFGGVGMGDPAADVIAAWSVFGPAGRETYRAALDVDDDTWNRARGFALLQAVAIIPYYRTTNPDFVTMAKRTVEQIVAECEASRHDPDAHVGL